MPVFMNTMQIHILLIEDNPGDAHLIGHMLSEAQGFVFQLTWVENLTAGIQRLRHDCIDVVLLDLGLPESSGLDTLRRLFDHAPKVPTLVVLSGLMDENIAFQAVQSGAQDYLIKGQVDSALLVRSIRYALERSQAEEALRLAHAELEQRVEERTLELANAVKALHAEIAERKRTEEALQEREVLIRHLVQSNIIGIFLWDIKGGINEANDALLQITGYSREDLTTGNLRWEAMTPPEYQSVDAWAVEELRSGGSCTPYEKEFIRKDGTRVPVLIGGGLIQGSMQNGIAFVLDLSARKQAYAERQAREVAEAASQAKSEFLANISHELRSPLNTIIGFSRLVARKPGLSREVQEDMNIILRSGEHLHTLINQVLNLSKIEAGQISLNETGFDLDRLLNELEDMFSVKSRDKGLQLFIKRVHDVPPYVRADLVKLRQVLINLISNAIKFTEKGGVTLELKQQQLSSDECRLLFEVSDTGYGIAPEEMDSIFDAFTQTGAGRQAQDGTGLGLTISRSFVRLMGGDIRINSQVGRGTTVNFDIPVQIVDVSALVAATDAEPHQLVALAPGQPIYRILVADDQRTARQLLVRLLAPLGFSVREASNGQEALEVWQTWRPHLIWMDMRMPVLDGREAARRIKNAPEGGDTIIIALTASGFEEERAEMLDAGCDDFLSKPFAEADFFHLMQKHLGLQFAYQEDAILAVAPSSHRLEPASLVKLPARLLAILEQALVQLDAVAVDRAIAEIRMHDFSLADTLQTLTDEFQYDRILHVLQHARS